MEIIASCIAQLFNYLFFFIQKNFSLFDHAHVITLFFVLLCFVKKRVSLFWKVLYRYATGISLDYYRSK